MNRCRVLSSLPDEIPLSQINIFGTHDSAANYVYFGKSARCQTLEITQQLNLGVRLLDIRLHKCFMDFYLVHGFANCYIDKSKKSKMKFEFVLTACEKFLRENPMETIILSIKVDKGIHNDKFFSAFYKKYISGNEEKWYLKNKIPILSECRGKIVLMRRCKSHNDFNDIGGLDFSLWGEQGDKLYYPLNMPINSNQKAIVQDRYYLEAEDKWENCAKKALDEVFVDENNIALHFLSTSIRNKKQGLDKSAEIIASHFKEYPIEKAVGWLLFDFSTKELIDKLTASNFEIYQENNR